MECKHEWIKLSGTFGKCGAMTATACHKCMKTSDEIELEQQLAACQKELAETRELRFAAEVAYKNSIERRDAAEQRTEHAETAVAKALQMAYEEYWRFEMFRNDVDDYCEELGEKCKVLKQWRREKQESEIYDILANPNPMLRHINFGGGMKDESRG